MDQNVLPVQRPILIRMSYANIGKVFLIMFNDAS